MKMFEADNTDEDGFKWQQHSKARDFGAEQKKDWRQHTHGRPKAPLRIIAEDGDDESQWRKVNHIIGKKIVTDQRRHWASLLDMPRMVMMSNPQWKKVNQYDFAS